MRQYYLSDVGLIQHKNNLTQTVTYKLFSYLSAGLPILNSLQSEMADIIRENRVGFNNDNGDVAGLVQNIERFLADRDLLNTYKENALNLTRKKGDSTAVYDRMLKLFGEVAGQKKKEAVTT
jgi:glycosyltransferase involved in cell wall biosynthesis